MERHAAAAAARREFGDFLEDLKETYGIERRKVADIMGVPSSTISRMGADEVKDRPTLAPPRNWRRFLGEELGKLGAALVERSAALALAAVDDEPDERLPSSAEAIDGLEHLVGDKPEEERDDILPSEQVL